MRSLSRVGLLAGLILLTVSALGAASAPPTALLIEADVVTIDLDRQRTEAVGQAHLTSGDLSLRASEFVADRLAGRVEAKGDLELAQGGRRLKGKSLQYDLSTEEGVLSEAWAAEQGVIMVGEKIVFSPTNLVAHKAYFTTCDHPSPHYSFGADLISLSAPQTPSGGHPRSGRLTLDRAEIRYRGRRLFTVPRYSVLVGELGQPDTTPLPATGFSREDGPYATISYTLGDPARGGPALADLNYRYTTFRGIRGYLRLRQAVGPFELTAGYTRREDSSDRQLLADDLEASFANVLLDRTPEYGIRLADFPIGGPLSLRAEWLRGDYSERIPYEEEARASADRVSRSILLTTKPYAVSHGLTLSHAVGCRGASYSPGERFSARFSRHRADLDLGPHLRLCLAHITRRGSGETPFLFDQPGPARELLAELRWRVSPGWRLHLADLYDLERKAPRDIILEATRTAHCLEYTVGWRKQRGTFFVGIGLVPPSTAEKQP